MQHPEAVLLTGSSDRPSSMRTILGQEFLFGAKNPEANLRLWLAHMETQGLDFGHLWSCK